MLWGHFNHGLKKVIHYLISLFPVPTRLPEPISGRGWLGRPVPESDHTLTPSKRHIGHRTLSAPGGAYLVRCPSPAAGSGAAAGLAGWVPKPQAQPGYWTRPRTRPSRGAQAPPPSPRSPACSAAEMARAGRVARRRRRRGPYSSLVPPAPPTPGHVVTGAEAAAAAAERGLRLAARILLSCALGARLQRGVRSPGRRARSRLRSEVGGTRLRGRVWGRRRISGDSSAQSSLAGVQALLPLCSAPCPGGRRTGALGAIPPSPDW